MSFIPATQEEVLALAIRRHADVRSGERIKTKPPVTAPTIKLEDLSDKPVRDKGRRLTLIEISRTYLGLPVAEKHKEITLKDICKEVCEHYGISRLDFVGVRRTQRLSRVRWIASHICKKLTTKGSSEVARYMCRDHTSVLHGQKAIEAKVVTDKKLSAEIDMLIERIQAKFGIPIDWPDSE